ncbi:cbb3-type cytochrome c oxidase subunit 3 [Thiobaca trueperi]|uniref:Cytochrome c oxidase cbb3-type subunit 4 n=1 Tax=Thiobaca trueperi TaxID=127458 RepID=A0A4R3MXN9_9GAMM|nr:cbb3-type cytochrome c oxidase subunit 3 [Thiobaca trueperi]TCT21400.1 cytochrome c oxidase cbb3-type subunit 4 [Thiobaca trueperi]
MNSLVEYFQTNWQAMTVNDWIGTILTVVIFLLMILAYFHVFRPKNRERLEAMKHIPFDEDNERNGDSDGGK